MSYRSSYDIPEQFPPAANPTTVGTHTSPDELIANGPRKTKKGSKNDKAGIFGDDSRYAAKLNGTERGLAANSVKAAKSDGRIQAAKLMPIIQPLCNASGEVFKPIELGTGDMIEIDLDDEGRRFVVQVVSYIDGVRPEDGGQLNPGGPTYNATNMWVKRCPEASFHPDKRPGHWILGGTDFSALIIHHIFHSYKIIYKSDEAKLFYEYLLTRFLVQTNTAKAAAEYKINGVISKLPDNWLDHPERPLAAYQTCAALMAYKNESFAAYMQQGTGKTPLMVAVVCNEAQDHYNRETKLIESGVLKNRSVYRVIIVCPKQVRTNWEIEFQRFGTVPGKTSILRGGKTQRIKCLIDGIRNEPGLLYAVCIVGYDAVERTWEGIGRIPWKRGILDESHYIKSPFSHRFKTMRLLRECCLYRTELTGTPIANNMMDLYAQLEFLGEGLSGFMSFKNFKSFHGKFETVGASGVHKLIGAQNVALIRERLARLSFMITKKEAGLNLPEKTYDVFGVEMTKQQAEWYQQVQSQLSVQVEGLMNDEGFATNAGGKRMSVEHILTMLLRLEQITSGFVKWDESIDPLTGAILRASRIEAIPGGNPKREGLLELMEEDYENNPGIKQVIWCTFVEDIRGIQEMLTAHFAPRGFRGGTYYGATKDADRDSNIAAFNRDDNFRWLVCHPQSAGEGLNLLGYNKDAPETSTTYAGHEIWFSKNWSAIQRSQGEDRCHRRGMRGPAALEQREGHGYSLRITDLECMGTIDAEIRQRVFAKIENAGLVLDVKELLASVLNMEGIASMQYEEEPASEKEQDIEDDEE